MLKLLKMKIFRFQRKRLIITIICIILLFILNYLLWSDKDPTSDCNVPNKVHEKIEELITKILSALEALQLSYFICYHSLWGALKSEGPLMWHKTVDLCILNKEVSKIDEVFLVRTFKRHGLLIRYNYANGIYTATLFGENEPTGILTVFEQDPITRQMRRVGWTHRLLPPNSCDKLHCFPLNLIETPLPKINFGQHQLPAPREGIEIQKYLFPDSWWKDTVMTCT